MVADMDLDKLINLHELSGVDLNQPPPGTDGSANCLTFVLDGRAWCAVEDEDDGYRSSMRSLVEVPVENVKNRFAPVTVVATHDSSHSDILRLHDFATGNLVLEVGTNEIDDYYPSFVASFTPENMVVNEQALAEVRIIGKGKRGIRLRHDDEVPG